MNSSRTSTSKRGRPKKERDPSTPVGGGLLCHDGTCGDYVGTIPAHVRYPANCSPVLEVNTRDRIWVPLADVFGGTVPNDLVRRGVFPENTRFQVHALIPEAVGGKCDLCIKQSKPCIRVLVSVEGSGQRFFTHKCIKCMHAKDSCIQCKEASLEVPPAVLPGGRGPADTLPPPPPPPSPPALPSLFPHSGASDSPSSYSCMSIAASSEGSSGSSSSASSSSSPVLLACGGSGVHMNDQRRHRLRRCHSEMDEETLGQDLEGVATQTNTSSASVGMSISPTQMCVDGGSGQRYHHHQQQQQQDHDEISCVPFKRPRRVAFEQQQQQQEEEEEEGVHQEPQNSVDPSYVPPFMGDLWGGSMCRSLPDFSYWWSFVEETGSVLPSPRMEEEGQDGYGCLPE